MRRPIHSVWGGSPGVVAAAGQSDRAASVYMCVCMCACVVKALAVSSCWMMQQIRCPVTLRRHQYALAVTLCRHQHAPLHTLIKKGWVSNVTSAIKLDLKPGTTAPGNVSLWQYHKAAWQHRRAAGHRPLTSPKLTACCHAHSANH
eukprot:scaffold122293_cov21-Tisochrysis_lutea.AAC.1